MENSKDPKWAGDPHQEWKTRVADENRLIVVDAQSNVIMRADCEATVAEWWIRNSQSAKYRHARVYREIDMKDYLEAAIVANEEKEARVRERRAEEYRRKWDHCLDEDEGNE